MDSNLRAKFKAELQRIYPELRARAELLVRRSGWRRRFDMNRQSVADDLLNETVLRVWSEDRRAWDPEKGPLMRFLVWEMKSVVYNAANNSENRSSSLDEAIGDGAETKLSRLESGSPTAEELLIQEERSAQLESVLLEAAGDDAVLLKYVEATMDGAGSPAEIAKRTGLSVEVVYQAHRKLVRRAKARQAKETGS